MIFLLFSIYMADSNRKNSHGILRKIENFSHQFFDYIVSDGYVSTWFYI